MNDFGAEDDFAPNQVLPVANLPGDFDGAPQDGMEYLFTVRRDAKSLPRFTRVNNPYEVDEVVPLARSGAPRAEDNEALPSEEWRISFTRSFKNYRQNLKQAVDKPLDKVAIVPLPSFQSREAWWNYIAGPKLVDQDTSQEKPSAAAEGETPTVEAHTNGASSSAKAIQTQREPTLSVLKQLSMKNTVQLLYWHSAWIDEFTDRLEQGQSPKSAARPLLPVHTRWMFTLLGILDDHLTSYDISTLRSLARSCLRLIKAMGDTQEEAVVISEPQEVGELTSSTSDRNQGRAFGGYWMVFAAIVSVWGQTDLWDEARQEFTEANA